MKPVVLVTEKEYRKGEQVFAAAGSLDTRPAPADEAALADEVRKQGASAVVVGVEPYGGPLYEALSEAVGDRANALIARFGVGFDGIDLKQANRYGIWVTNTPGVLDQSVAEHALWLMGALARNVVAGDAAMRQGTFPTGSGFELAGKTLGILGFGPIGQRVARIAYQGFGMTVLATDLLPIETIAGRSGTTCEQITGTTGITALTQDATDVIKQSDVVSIHLPSLPATRHFINAEKLACFRTGALLINTARGPLVDENALFDALSTGPLAGAALDVFESEPYCPVDSKKDLRRLGNVVLTPHVGSSTVEANQRMASACVANVQAFLDASVDDLTCVPGNEPGKHVTQQTKKLKVTNRTKPDRWQTTHSQMTMQT